MVRTVITLLLFFVLAVPAAAAERWTFDPATKTASISNGGAALIVACAGRSVGIMYQVNKSTMASELRGRKNTVFAFSDSGRKRTVLEVPLATSGNQSFMAFRGAAANEVIERLAAAPRRVSAGFGLTQKEGYALFNVTEFSAAGSGAAIRSVVSVCKR